MFFEIHCVTLLLAQTVLIVQYIIIRIMLGTLFWLLDGLDLCRLGELTLCDPSEQTDVPRACFCSKDDGWDLFAALPRNGARLLLVHEGKLVRVSSDCKVHTEHGWALLAACLINHAWQSEASTENLSDAMDTRLYPHGR